MKDLHHEHNDLNWILFSILPIYGICLLYTSDAADEQRGVDLGGRRIIKKKKSKLNSIFEKFRIKLIKIFFRIFPLEIVLFLISKLGIIKLGLNSAYFKKDKVDKELINIVSKPVLRKTSARALRAMCIGMATRGDKLKASYLLEQLSLSKKIPFLLLWGEKDNFIPLFLGKKIAKFHRWVELKIISNSGHCVHDEDPSLFNEISYKWIRDLQTQ